MYNELLIASSLLFCFICNFYIFHFISKTIENSNRNPLLHFLLSAVNTFTLASYYMFNLPHFMVYEVILLALCLEIFILVRGRLSAAFTASAAFSLQITFIHVTALYIISMFIGVFPVEMITTDEYRYLGLLVSSIAFLALLIALDKIPSQKSVFSKKNINRLATSPKYSSIISVYCTAIIVLYSFYAYFLLTDEIFPQQLVIVIGMLSFNVTMFVYTFTYLVNFVNMVVYKRYSDIAEDEHNAIQKTKKLLVDKIKKDDLTQLYNKKYIENLIGELCSMKDVNFCILFIDVNSLKQINDTFGHDAGDRLLLKVGKAISASVRSEDFVARLGGDELVVVLIDATEQYLSEVIHRIEKNIQIQDSSEDFPMSASIGAVYVDNELRNLGVSAILDMADKNMMENKKDFYKAMEVM